MTITLDELRTLVANAKSVQPDFWKDDPLYISLGAYAVRRALTTETFIVNTGNDIAIDLDAEGQAMGIEFLPLGR